MAASDEVIWHTPTEYNPYRDGPPYLPMRPFDRTAADAAPAIHPGPPSPLHLVLAGLQALAALHQTHHWSTRGTAYYADHLMFERLYNDSLEFIDQVAERAVGIGDPAAIFALHQIKHQYQLLEVFGIATTPDEMVEVSLKAETSFLEMLDQTIANMEVEGSMTHGISNLLEGVADGHEVFVYLLRQRAQTGGGSYSYDRA
jgi:DNA-binding ferritin-like protein